MARFGMLQRSAHGIVFLFGVCLAACSGDGIRNRLDAGGEQTCGTIVCKTVPPSTAECRAERCLITLASGQNSPSDIVTDSTNVYWSNHEARLGTSAVMSVPLGGGTPVTLATDQEVIPGIAVDSTSVYWTKGSMDGAVMKTALNGGAPTTLASGQAGPEHIAVDATSVYWTNRGRESMPTIDNADGAVMTVSLDGGVPTTLASRVYPWDIAVDATSVYWSEGNTGNVMKVPLAGGTPTSIASARSAGSIAVDSTSVYWGAGRRGVEKAPLGGGPVTTVATLPWPEVATGLAVDGTDVYWITGHAEEWNVMRAPLAGGTPEILASGRGTPGSLAVDATSVYWATWSTLEEPGTVMKLTPK
jgi:hypothetical protein